MSVHAQSRYADSLQNLLTGKIADTTRWQTMIALGDNFTRSDAGKARDYFFQTYLGAKEKNQSYYTVSALNGMANTWLYENKYDSARYYLHMADSFNQFNNYNNRISLTASLKTNLAALAEHDNKDEQALKYYLEAVSAMQQSKEADKEKALGVMYLDIGNIYHKLNQNRKALEYDLRGLHEHQQAKQNELFTAYAQLYVANDYTLLDNEDSAQVFFKSAEKLADEIQSPDLFYEVYSNVGTDYKRRKKNNIALEYYDKALQYAEETSSLFRKMDIQRLLGFVYRDMQNYPASASHLEKALVLSRELKNRRLEAEILRNLAVVNAAMGADKTSVKYYTQYIALNDSLHDVETQKNINEIETKYQAAKKEAAINTLQKNNAVQKASLERKNIINAALIAGCIFLLVIAILLYKNFKNKNRLLFQKEEIHRQELAELEKQRRLDAVQSVLKGEEEERSRLARDLHDGIGGLLSGLKLSMSTMKGNVFLSEENAKSFSNVIDQLDVSIAELRRVSHNMMPEALIKFGLKEALENYCESLNYSGRLQVRLQAYGMESRMEQSVEIVIYRIIQELLNNVIKHAEAKNVLIQLVREGERFNITVEDDGKGFDINKVAHGAGLANIRARAAYLNGTVDIVSTEGEGTSVHVEGSTVTDTA